MSQNVVCRISMLAYVCAVASVLFAAAIMCARVAVAQSNVPAVTVISGGTLIDGTGKPPVKDAVIVIEGNKFKAVGEKGKMRGPAGAKTVDATGKFILPGLFDAHIHYRNYVPELFLAYGITSAIDMGNATDWILAQRDGIAKGKIKGPRLFVSGDALSGGTAGGGATLYQPQTVAQPPVNTIEQTRAAVKALIAKGVDKIGVSIGQDPKTFPVIIEEAHKAGIPISAYTMYPREEVEMGLDIIEHSYSISAGTKKDPAMLEQMRRERGASRYDKHPLYYLAESDGGDDFIKLLVAKKAYVIPSLVFEYKLIHDHVDEFKQDYLQVLTNPNLRYLPYDDYLAQVMNADQGSYPRLGGPGFFGSLDRTSADTKRYHDGYKELGKFLVKLNQAGGRILVGTDAPNLLPPGITLHHEMQLLVDSGLTPMQVIVGATRLPAESVRKDKLLGTVEAGKLADLLILKADPLEDIKNTRQIDTVMKDGKVVDTTLHPYFTNPIPRPIISEAEYNPLPSIRRLVPGVAKEGDRDLALTIEGAGIYEGATVMVDGLRVPTQFQNERHIQATIPSRLLKRPGTLSIAVVNARPGGGVSNDLKFYVRFHDPSSHEMAGTATKEMP